MWVIIDLLKYLLGGVMQVVAFILAIGFPGYFIMLAIAENGLGNLEYILCFIISFVFWRALYATKPGNLVIKKYLQTAFKFLGG